MEAVCRKTHFTLWARLQLQLHAIVSLGKNLKLMLQSNVVYQVIITGPGTSCNCTLYEINAVLQLILVYKQFQHSTLIK